MGDTSASVDLDTVSVPGSAVSAVSRALLPAYHKIDRETARLVAAAVIAVGTGDVSLRLRAPGRPPVPAGTIVARILLRRGHAVDPDTARLVAAAVAAASGTTAPTRRRRPAADPRQSVLY